MYWKKCDDCGKQMSEMDGDEYFELIHHGKREREYHRNGGNVDKLGQKYINRIVTKRTIKCPRCAKKNRW